MRCMLMLLLSAAILFSVEAKAGQKKNALKPTPNWSAMSCGEYVAALSLTPKTKPAVRAFMQKEIARLSSQGYEITTVRDSLIARVEIPSARLFTSNDVEVSDAGKKLLRSLLPVRPSDYRIWVSVHTSNVGSADYVERFSLSRAQSVAAVLSKDGMIVVPFGAGNSEPIAKNDSYTGRETNRRVEIYFIPSDALVVRLNSQK